MRQFRVKYLPPNDMLYAYRLEDIEKMSVQDVKQIDINDAVEYNEIHKYFETGVCLKCWTNEQFERYKNLSHSLYILAQRFFQSVNNQNIIEHYQKVDIGYSSCFWDCFCACKLHNRISPHVFSQLIQTESVNGKVLFQHKELVKSYGNELREFILNNEIGISILIDEFEQKRGLFIPEELKTKDKIEYVEKYIDSPNPHPNTLLSIYYMHSSKKFPISDAMRLKAKRKYEARVNELSKNGIVMTHEIKLVLSDSQTEEVKISCSQNGMTFSYSLNWLDETMDYPSVLNNFIYIFGYADYEEMRWSLVSLKSEIGLIEHVFAMDRSASYYPDGEVFREKNKIAHMQMDAYYKYLLSKNIRLEEVLEWFYTEYLQTEFDCPKMRVKLPSKDLSFAEKCCTIIPAFDSAIKQFLFYVEHGEIDFELIAMSSKQPKYNEIPSMISKKNIYGGNEIYYKLSECLFSNDSLLSYVRRLDEQGKSYNSFVELLAKETVLLSDYQDEEKEIIMRLVHSGFLKIEDNGVIALDLGWKLRIFAELYKNERINRFHYSDDAQPVFDVLLSTGVLKDDSFLFAKTEANYLNYYLNCAEYCNGQELRNKYVHGNLQVIADENEHYYNYLTLLILFVLITVKINDEFMLKEQLQLNDDLLMT